MRRLLVIAAICGLALGAVSSATASDQSSMNTRTRAFVAMFRLCQSAVGDALVIVKHNPSDRLGASKAVSEAKSACESVRHRMALFDTTHFRDQALDAEIAVDDFKNGMGHLSDFIDTSTPSDATSADKDLGNGEADAPIVLREINQRRAVYHLKPLR